MRKFVGRSQSLPGNVNSLRRHQFRSFFGGGGGAGNQSFNGSSLLGSLREIAVKVGALKSEEEMGSLSHLSPLVSRKQQRTAPSEAAAHHGGEWMKSSSSSNLTSGTQNSSATSPHDKSSSDNGDFITASRSQQMRQSDVLWSQSARSQNVELRLPPIPRHIRPGELVIRLSTSGEKLLIGTKQATIANGRVKPLASWALYRPVQIPSYAVQARLESAKFQGVSVSLRDIELAAEEDPGYELRWKFDGNDSRPVIQLEKYVEDLGEEWPCLFDFPYEKFTVNTDTGSSVGEVENISSFSSFSSGSTVPLYLSERDFTFLLDSEYNPVKDYDEAMEEVQWFENRYGIRVEKETTDLSSLSTEGLARREAIRGLNADVKKLLQDAHHRSRETATDVLTPSSAAVSTTAKDSQYSSPQSSSSSSHSISMGQYLTLAWLSFTRGALLSLELAEEAGHSLMRSSSTTEEEEARETITLAAGSQRQHREEKPPAQHSAAGRGAAVEKAMPQTLIRNEDFVTPAEESLSSVELVEEALEELRMQDLMRQRRDDEEQDGDPRLAAHLLKLAAINKQDPVATIHLYNLFSEQFPQQQQLGGLLLWRQAMLPDNRPPFPILPIESEQQVTKHNEDTSRVDSLVNNFVGDLHEMGHPGFRRMVAPAVFFWQRAFVAGDRSAAAKIARALLLGELRGIHGRIMQEEQKEKTSTTNSRKEEKERTINSGTMARSALLQRVGELWLKVALDSGSPLANFVQSQLLKETVRKDDQNSSNSGSCKVIRQEVVHYANKAYAASPQLMDSVIEMEDDNA